MVANSYQFLAADMLISALGYEAQTQIFAIFWRIVAFFKLSVLPQIFDLGE